MEEDYTIRWSNEDDKIRIQNLLYNSFGSMVENEGAYEGIDKGRYLVLSLPGQRIVAITGFQHKSDYPGIEITWTTTDRGHRNKGYMQALFSRLLQTTDQPVYCCCWRIGEKDRVNLQTLMDMFGFHEVLHDMNKYDYDHICPSRVSCPYYRFAEAKCICAKDLYLRPGNCHKKEG